MRREWAAPWYSSPWSTPTKMARNRANGPGHWRTWELAQRRKQDVCDAYRSACQKMAIALGWQPPPEDAGEDLA